VQVVHAVEGKTATAGSCERLDSALAGGAGPPIFLCVLWHRQPAMRETTSGVGVSKSLVAPRSRGARRSGRGQDKQEKWWPGCGGGGWWGGTEGCMEHTALIRRQRN